MNTDQGFKPPRQFLGRRGDAESRRHRAASSPDSQRGGDRSERSRSPVRLGTIRGFDLDDCVADVQPARQNGAEFAAWLDQAAVREPYLHSRAQIMESESGILQLLKTELIRRHGGVVEDFPRHVPLGTAP